MIEANNAPELRDKGLTNVRRWQVFERDNYRCVWCQAKYDLSVDHMQPQSKGGGHGMENLQTLCRPCNSQKKDDETITEPVWRMAIIDLNGDTGWILKPIAEFEESDYVQAIYGEIQRKSPRPHRLKRLIAYAENHGFMEVRRHAPTIFEQLLMEV